MILKEMVAMNCCLMGSLFCHNLMLMIKPDKGWYTIGRGAAGLNGQNKNE
jgi:hypothetical protein